MKLLQRLATTSAVIASTLATASLASAEDVDLELVPVSYTHLTLPTIYSV